ncbi:MAG: nucleoside triphosphate pyrophosphohydrolase [Pseudomonadota bacterium]
MAAVYTLSDLLRVMQRLRDPDGGCPWDLQQTFESIVPSTLEECYELAATIEQGDYPHMAEELGDVLFQVVFYAQMATEQKLFSFEDVVDTLVDKLVRRHPHVFADGKIEGRVSKTSSVSDVKDSWESIKAKERSEKNLPGLLDDVPVALPALPRAQKLQKRAARVGFDWASFDGVIAKLREELTELQNELERNDTERAAEELGDLMFSCVNLARHLGEDAEHVLRRANSKFERRFRAMESSANSGEQALANLDSEQLDELWREAKRQDL